MVFQGKNKASYEILCSSSLSDPMLVRVSIQQAQTCHWVLYLSYARIYGGLWDMGYPCMATASQSDL